MSEKYFKLISDNNAKGIVNETFATERELREVANFFLGSSKHDWKNVDYLQEDLEEVIKFVELYNEVIEIDEEEYKKKTLEEEPKTRKFEIVIFMAEVKDPEDDLQQMYSFVEEFPISYSAIDVANTYKKEKFITYPHHCGRGLLLINMDHISEISIHEYEEEEEEEA